jgi:competence protein ComEC
MRITLAAIIVLSMLSAGIWYAVYEQPRREDLTVSFLDVGQGDAVFIQSPTGQQILIDGGPGSRILRMLPTVMPWYDRSLDLVVGTHADLDHIGGLIELLPRYRVSFALVPSTMGESDAWRTYLEELKAEERSGARVYQAKRGEHIDIGGGAYVDVLFPDRDVPDLETNTGCVVARLVYGETAFMLSCDAPSAIEQYLALLDGTNLKANVLKAGHHGSKTSSHPLFVGLVDPEYAVFSRGCDNTYGHPSQQTIDTFERFNIPTLDTCTDGTVTFVSDGHTVARK